MCGKPIDIQSKGGECSFDEYLLWDDIPLGILADIENTQDTCSNCNTEVMVIVTGTKPILVPYWKKSDVFCYNEEEE